jgi:selenocysteine lyase/cysteine desulfurase
MGNIKAACILCEHRMATISETRERLRAAMPVTRKWAYLDHAAMSPLPQPTADAFQKWLAEAVETGNPAWPGWVKEVESMRAKAAQMIGAHPEEIALIGNTTAGISLVAEGIDWRPGDNVVTLADEFPSNVYPWFNLESRGVETRRVPTEQSGELDINKLAAACDDRTRIVTISWIGFATGYRHDVKRIASIAHEKGALMFLDASST